MVLDGLVETLDVSNTLRLVQQDGAYINGKQYLAIDTVVDANLLEENALILRAGKKRYHRVVLGESSDIRNG